MHLMWHLYTIFLHLAKVFPNIVSPKNQDIGYPLSVDDVGLNGEDANLCSYCVFIIFRFKVPGSRFTVKEVKYCRIFSIKYLVSI